MFSFQSLKDFDEFLSFIHLFIFQAVNSILRHVAQIQGFKSNEELEDLYRKTAWRFEGKNKKKGSSYDWFKQVRSALYNEVKSWSAIAGL